MTIISPASGVSGMQLGKRVGIRDPSGGGITPVKYSLFQAASGGSGLQGPANVVAYSGPFIAGVQFQVLQSGMWFHGYYYWFASNFPVLNTLKCALTSVMTGTTGFVVPGSVVSRNNVFFNPGWNFIPLPTPVQIAPGDTLIAGVGFNTVVGFSDLTNGWGASVTKNGPLMAFGGGAGVPVYMNGGVTSDWSISQGPFSSVSADPSTTMAAQASGSDNFCVDVLVGNAGTAPAGYNGTYRLWPNSGGGGNAVAIDDAQDYEIATQINLSRSATTHFIWALSPAGATSLPTSVSIWSIGSPGTSGTRVFTNASPTWLNGLTGGAGAAGGGWVKTAVNTTLPAGKYRVGVYNANGTLGAWGAKRLGYWGFSTASSSGGGPASANGSYGNADIVNGPLTAPTTAHADLCFSFNPSAGNPTEPGQSPFVLGPPDSYPNQYVGVHSTAGNLFQSYYIDLEVS